jgi:integrase
MCFVRDFTSKLDHNDGEADRQCIWTVSPGSLLVGLKTASGNRRFSKQANATAFLQWRSWLRGGRSDSAFDESRTVPSSTRDARHPVSTPCLNHSGACFGIVFSHIYRAWLDETGAPVGVQQKLMRHAHVSTTMGQYGNASALAKRKANRPIVQRLLRRSATQRISIQ